MEFYGQWKSDVAYFGEKTKPQLLVYIIDVLVWEPRPLTNKGLNMIIKNGDYTVFHSNH